MTEDPHDPWNIWFPESLQMLERQPRSRPRRRAHWWRALLAWLFPM